MYKARRRRVDFKILIPRLLLLFLVFCLLIFCVRAIIKSFEMKYDDTIVGSPYEAVEMPIPTATPTPPPPEIPIVEPKHEAELVSVFNQPEKIAFLTFDDGPTAKITPQILDILQEKGVRATFFVLGANVEKNPDLAKRATSEGHVLANHSYSHDYKSLYDSTEFFLEDIQKTESVIVETVGEEAFVKIFRFPGGSFEETKTPQKDALASIGYKYVDWNALNGDAEGQNVSPDVLLENIRKTTSGRRNVVILMHDAATKQTTADSLRSIIDHLASEGFQFRTLKDIPLS